MGGIKKLFGGGSMPKPVEVAPAVQAVESTDTSADTLNSNTQKKRKQGFTSTQAGTLMTSNESTNRDTLG